mgnify:CR=1 FL=1|tara:strand:+ start:9785 stop:12307 length:2523 start_codon:yes stop_codon:yes gene_type:complete
MQETIDWGSDIAIQRNPVSVDLPILQPGQVHNVEMIEARFEIGKGRMITDGTGTGKTYTGLGVAKRFSLLGKNKQLIVTPTDDKCKDWILEGNRVNLFITQLKDSNDMGRGIRTTTYANFYQNQALLREEFDLIIYDESHYIMQNAAGKETSCFDQHKLICSLPSVFEKRGAYFIGRRPFTINSPSEATPEKIQANKIWQKRCYDKGLELYHKTKVLFMSATPFAYVKNIKYCDGLMWDIEERLNEELHPHVGYGQPTRWEKFLIDNFGYQMKNGKLQKPDVEVDTSILERDFFERAKEKNLMSTRVLELDVDYSRHFIKVDTELGLKIDEFFSLLWNINDVKMSEIRFIFKRHFNHIFTSKMVESAKAENLFDRIDTHLMLGRKIVIFHGYNNIDITHPFRIDNCRKYLDKDERWREHSLNRLLEQFYEAYPEYANYDVSHLRSVPEIIKGRYKKRCVLYNGTIGKPKRRRDKDTFMDDDSDVDIIVIQSQAGQAGISLHDLTGFRPRVSIDMSLPTRPPEAIQKEGRTYRWGSLSNAIYEYPTLQTAMERMVFAYTIAERTRTVENLAMGNLARDLESAFKNGYENFEEGLPNIGQGRLGKAEDKKLTAPISPFQKSITYYYQKQKANKKRNKALHTDFFATPEPIAFKMVEWANDNENMVWLDPSCGDGAIARFFPDNTKRIAIDVDAKLLSLCKLKANVDAKHMDFIEYKINNKADRIIMNPPFGYGGKTAIEHLLKALIHLRKDKGNAKLYCIIPRGSSCEKHFERMSESANMKFFNYTGEILLPKCTFNRAATSVATRIVRFEGTHIAQHFRSIDLTYVENNKQLFEVFEHLEF